MKKMDKSKVRNKLKKNKEAIQNLRKILIYLKENFQKEVVDKRKWHIRYWLEGIKNLIGRKRKLNNK